MADQVGMFSGTPRQTTEILHNDISGMFPNVPVIGKFYNFKSFDVPNASSGVTFNDDVLDAWPFLVNYRTHVDRHSFHGSSALVGSLVRFAVFDNDPVNRIPRNKIIDIGEIDISGASLYYSTNIDYWFAPGIYWNVMVKNNLKIIWALSNLDELCILGYPDNTTQNNDNFYNVAMAYGAIPNTFPPGGAFSYAANGMPNVLYRIAA